MFFLCVFFPLGSVSFAAVIGLEQNSTGGYGAGTLSYDCCGPSFMGSLTVSDLTEGMVYQMKLEGQPADDPVGNANLGSVGRWWVIDPSDPSGWGGRNTTDAGRLIEEAAGFTVLGYLSFDYFTATESEQTINYYADWSYHTAGVDERGSIVMPEWSYQATFLLTENIAPYGSPLLKKDISFDVPCVVPIPSTVLLFGSGLGLVIFGRRKFKK